MMKRIPIEREGPMENRGEARSMERMEKLMAQPMPKAMPMPKGPSVAPKAHGHPSNNLGKYLHPRKGR